MVHREGALNWEELLNAARSGKYVQVANVLGIYNIPDDNEVSEGTLHSKQELRVSVNN